jgi:hypothetical protein
MLTCFLAAALTALAYYFAVALIFHFGEPTHRVRAMIQTGILACLIAPLVWRAVAPFSPIHLNAGIECAAAAVLIFWFAAFGYLIAYFSIVSSISVEYLVQVAESPEKSLTRRELEAVFPFEPVLKHRFDALVNKKLIRPQVEGAAIVFVPTQRCLFYAALFLKVKTFLKWGTGG